MFGNLSKPITQLIFQYSHPIDSHRELFARRNYRWWSSVEYHLRMILDSSGLPKPITTILYEYLQKMRPDINGFCRKLSNKEIQLKPLTECQTCRQHQRRKQCYYDLVCVLCSNWPSDTSGDDAIYVGHHQTGKGNVLVG